MSITNESVMGSCQIAGRVTRYHTWPMLRKPTVAEHSARVATLYVELWGLPRAEVLYYCLNHDNGELASGDAPFYSKRAVPELGAATNKAEKMGMLTLGIKLPELSEDEYRRFKMADYCEMWETAVVERNMGNKYADAILDNLRPAIYKTAEELSETNKMIRWIRENQPNG